VASYPNLAFSLAKLVPGASGSPSKWVSYIVTTVPTTTAASAPQRPGTDNTGTLVDNGNGTYKYTFYRDVTKIKADVAAMTVTAPNNTADLGDLTYEPSLTHRLTIQVSGNAPGTGTNTPTAVQVTPGVPMVKPVDVIFDFIPATGKAATSADASRDIVANENCNSCHSTLGGIPGDSAESSGAGFHGGSRNNVQYCVVCHTDQRRYGRTEAVYDPATRSFVKGTNGLTSTYLVDGRAIGNLPNLIHKTHLGEILTKKGYNYAEVEFNEVGYPQDIRNCTKCHDGTSGASGSVKTAQGDNWKSVPQRLACGACHDGINFATGKGVTLADAAKGLTTSQFGHVGGAVADDTTCAICHTAALINVYHTPVTPPNQGSFLHVAGGTGNTNTNSSWIASNTSRLPAGAIKVTYDLKSVSKNASKQPVMVFRMLQNGVRKDLNVFATAAVNPATGAKEIWDGFMGSPSVYFVFAVPQDGIAAPADFNATVSGYLRSIWNGAATGQGVGTLTGPDADGYYTATLTAVTIPDNAVMLTGGLGYSYNVRTVMPLTQTNLADYPTSASPVPVGATDATATSTQLLPSMPNKIGGLIVIAPNAQKVATGYTGRRPIVEDARCNKCHQELGTFTEDAFHAGQRNDGSTCAWCHRPNQTSSGWSADSTSFVHAIHAGAKRTVPYNWHAVSATENFSEIKYPGILARCEQCHLPGAYDYSLSTTQSVVNNRLYRTVATGTFASSAANAFTFSPYITKDVNYGAGFAFNAGTGVTTAAAATTLVTSPTATVCSSCHDSELARAHIGQNGGSLYLPRSTALGLDEACFICHASGKIADIKEVHAR
jgi:OmcA/MtrC family decaheme c-type cytochrome